MASEKRRWTQEDIPVDLLWWISEIDRLAWKAMQMDMGQRIRR